MLPPFSDALDQAIDLVLASLLERNGLKDWGASPDATVSQLYQADEALELTWKALRDEAVLRMAKVRKRINDKSLFHSMLPVELQIHIFMHVAQQQDGISKGRRPTAHILAEVSTRWATLTKETPELWSFIQLDPPLYPVTTTLRLSGNAPLQITCQDPSGQYRRNVFGHLQLVAMHAHRWQTFSLISSETSLVPHLQTCLNAAHALEELDLELRPRRAEQSAHMPLDVSQNSRLVRLHCENVRLSFISIPTTHLQSLSLSWIGTWPPQLHDLLALLQTCQLLEELHLGGPDNESESAASVPPPNDRLEMQRLRKLRVTNLPGWFADHLISRLRPARLRYFEVADYHPVWGAEILAKLIDPADSESSLLQSACGTIPPDQFRIVTVYSPHLRHLTLRAGKEDAGFGFLLHFRQITWPKVVNCMTKLHHEYRTSMQLRLEGPPNVDLLRMGEFVGLSELVIRQELDAASVLSHLTQRQIMENGQVGWPCPGLTKIWLMERSEGTGIAQLHELGKALTQVRGDAAKVAMAGDEDSEHSRASIPRVKALVIVYGNGDGEERH